MASAIRLMGQGIQHADLSHSAAGSAGVIVLDTIVEGATGFAIGEMYARYRKRWFGKHAPELFTAIGKGAALILSLLFDGDHAWAVSAFNSMGGAGVVTRTFELGLTHGRKSTGETVIVLPKGADTKNLPQGADVLGLDQAAPGKGMNWDRLEALSDYA